MASLKTNTEVQVDIDIDIECATCGRTLDATIIDTRISVDFCPKCYGKLEDEIENLNDKLEKQE